MKEKKVLLISYYFPPLGMGGVQRSLKFVKYLPQFGWKPLVLTVKEIEYYSKDFSLLDELPPEAEVFATNSFDPLRVIYLLKKFLKKEKRNTPTTKYSYSKSKQLNFLFLPDNKIGWLPFALVKSFFLYRKQEFNLIFSTYPPLTSHLLVLILKKFLKKPWVADFRDLRIGFEFEKHPSLLHKWVSEKIMQKTLKQANLVTVINEKMIEKLKKHFPQVKRIEIISQGYDERDFENKVSQKKLEFSIVYSGTLSLDADPEPFFEALSRFLKKGEIPKEKIKFLHIGTTIGINLEELIEKYELKEVVEITGYLPHSEIFTHLLSADLLLLLISEIPGGDLILTGKTYEYLRAQKPILAIIPEKGATAFLLNSLKIGRVISPNKTEEIENALLDYYKLFQQGKLSSQIPEIELEKFERKFLTSKIARLFDELVQKK